MASRSSSMVARMRPSGAMSCIVKPPGTVRTLRWRSDRFTAHRERLLDPLSTALNHTSLPLGDHAKPYFPFPTRRKRGSVPGQVGDANRTAVVPSLGVIEKCDAISLRRKSNVADRAAGLVENFANRIFQIDRGHLCDARRQVARPGLQSAQLTSCRISARRSVDHRRFSQNSTLEVETRTRSPAQESEPVRRCARRPEDRRISSPAAAPARNPGSWNKSVADRPFHEAP